MTWNGGSWSATGGSIHSRLHEFVKSCLLKILVDPYSTVCDLYCGCGADTEKWAQAQIGQYIGIDLSASALSEAREQWESHRRPYPAEFHELDPCKENLELSLPEKHIPTDIVCCLRNLQDCFASEEQARSLLQNVSSLLKPGGYFFGITADSSTIWSKYQKVVEAIKAGNMRPNELPRVRTEQYSIYFEDDRFTPFGTKYQIQFSDGLPSQSQLLVHFPSLLRLARDVGLENIEIQNTLEFYEDYRIHFSGILRNTCGSLVEKGRLSHRTHEILGLFTTFIFRKPDTNVVRSIRSPSETSETSEEFTCTQYSDTATEPCSEYAPLENASQSSLLDSKEQSQPEDTRLTETSFNDLDMPCTSDATDAKFTKPEEEIKDEASVPASSDEARAAEMNSCGKQESPQDDSRQQRELSVSNLDENAKQESQSHSTEAGASFKETNADSVSNVSPQKPSENIICKKTVELKCYSRSYHGHRRFLEGRISAYANKTQVVKHDTACENPQENGLHIHLEGNHSAESSGCITREETLVDSNKSQKVDNAVKPEDAQNSRTEGKSTSQLNTNDEEHFATDVDAAEVDNVESNSQKESEGDKECDAETISDNRLSTLGPAPSELRFQHPIDNCPN